jgi:altronate hydrolase
MRFCSGWLHSPKKFLSGDKIMPDGFPFDQLAIRLNPGDNVAIARRTISAGTVLKLNGRRITLTDEVPAGHKLALEAVAAGGEVWRYGYLIGSASRAIRAGEWVHSHNLEVGAMEHDYHCTLVSIPDWNPARRRTFWGYPRQDGRAGTRNFVAVISTVNCSGFVASRIAAHFTPERLAAFPNVDGVIAMVHHSGCSFPLGGEAYTNLQRTLRNTARNPNLAGFVAIGLGCEVNQLETCFEVPDGRLSGLNPAGENDAYLLIQDLGGTEGAIRAGVAAVERLLLQANAVRRVEMPASKLVVGLECGGSDAWSGVTANPVTGLAADRVVEQGGTAILSETPEIFGAEHLLTQRVTSAATGERLIACFQGWHAQAARYGFSIDNNPSPGNKAGGLTTIYEKSLGAVAKGGSSPLNGVYFYAEQVDRPGLVFMDTPGNDPASITGMVAGGANLVLFTTGRGSVFGGSLVPILKVASNTPMYERMQSDMDFNAGSVLDGESLEAAGDRLFELLLETASGQPSRAERLGPHEQEFIPWVPGGLL